MLRVLVLDDDSIKGEDVGLDAHRLESGQRRRTGSGRGGRGHAVRAETATQDEIVEGRKDNERVDTKGARQVIDGVQLRAKGEECANGK